MANGESFSVFQGEVGGHPLIAMIDVGLLGYKEKSTVPWFLRVPTPLVNPTADGLATDGSPPSHHLQRLPAAGTGAIVNGTGPGESAARLHMALRGANV